MMNAVTNLRAQSGHSTRPRQISVPWTASTVHPEKYEDGVDASKFVKDNGDIDWEAMAQAVLDE